VAGETDGWRGGGKKTVAGPGIYKNGKHLRWKFGTGRTKKTKIKKKPGQREAKKKPPQWGWKCGQPKQISSTPSQVVEGKSHSHRHTSGRGKTTARANGDSNLGKVHRPDKVRAKRGRDHQNLPGVIGKVGEQKEKKNHRGEG